MRHAIKVLFIINILVNFKCFASNEPSIENVDAIINSIDSEFNRCIKMPQNKGSKLVNCLYEIYSRWDKLLNETYQDILLKNKIIDKKEFINSQKIWLEFRKAEFKFIDDAYPPHSGLIFKFAIMKERIVEFKIYLRLTKDTKACAF